MPHSDVRVTRALISVSDKSGLVERARRLAALGVELVSTGGTSKALKDAGLDVKDVSELTGFPEMMDGRVKTLHPVVHGGLLYLRDNKDHAAAAKAHNIQPIDLVYINLYPFEATVAAGKDFDTCIENIDIGGPAMLRAAAKNHGYVAVCTDGGDVDAALDVMESNSGHTSADLRKKLAAKTYARTAAYDAAISSWYADQIEEQNPDWRGFGGALKQSLRYGENPHQTAAFYTTDEARPGVATVALGVNAIEAYKAALACDSTSAFGGIVALNRPLDGPTATEITKVFTEVVIAPGADSDALEIFKKKKNLRLLITDGLPDPMATGTTVKTVAGGLLVQSRDNGRITEADLKVVTKLAPTPEQLKDLLFAWRVAKHVKSNTIVYAKDGSTAGIGAGQMSRIDAARISALKAIDAAEASGWAEPRTKGCVAASDAFFPFPDGLLQAASAGASAVIQPGGSIRDDEVIAAANEAGLAMVFTGMRHFRH